MIYLDKSSDTLIILLHDSYGYVEHLVPALPLFDDLDCDVNCFDLQESRTRFGYSNEKKRVKDLWTDIGFEKSAENVLRLVRELKSRYKTIILIGFGVGATTTWLRSEDKGIDGVLGLCGSDIERFWIYSRPCAALLLYSTLKGMHELC